MNLGTICLVAMLGGGALYGLLRTHASRVAAVALCLVFAVNVLVPSFQLPSHPKYFELTTGVSFVCTLIGFVRSDRRSPGGVSLPIIILFVLLGFESIVVHSEPKFLGAIATFSLMLMAVVLGRRLDGQSIKVFLGAIWVLGFVEATYSIFEVAFRISPLWAGSYLSPITGQQEAAPNNVLVGSPRAQGTLGHPIPLAILVSYAICIVSTGAGVRKLRFRVPILCCLVAGLVCSGTRSALLIVPIILLKDLKFRSVASKRLTVGLLLILSILGYSMVSQDLLSALGLSRIGQTGSFSHRSSSLTSLIRVLDHNSLSQSLLGNGYLSIGPLFQQGILSNDGLQTIDNQLVTTFTEVGLVGLGAIITLLITGILKSSVTQRSVILVFLLSFLIFDSLEWPSIFFPALALAAFGANRSSTKAGPLLKKKTERKFEEQPLKVLGSL